MSGAEPIRCRSRSRLLRDRRGRGLLVAAGQVPAAARFAAAGDRSGDGERQSAGTTTPSSCTQDGWTHTIETGDEKTGGVRVVIDTGGTVNATSVVINNVSDFTGGVWENNIGNATATIIGTTFRVNGTAEGSTTADPIQRTTASFEIKANC